MAQLELIGVKKSFQSVEVVHGVDLVVPDGSFTVFVGPSGCGKSTLLRMIAGLEDVTQGEIRLNGKRCDHLLPSARGMAMVFQSYALYPHMNVRENLRFGLVCQGLPERDINLRIARAAEALQIGALLDRRPSQLSGGQSQRVAIGRAIVKEPQAFLFDEPLSNLDAALRVKMRSEIADLHRRLGATMVFVTHDQVEAMTMADQIVVLRDGRIEQVGTPIELYEHPRNRFVAGFLGAPQMNFLAASSAGDALLLDEGRAQVVFPGARGTLTLGVRPEHVTLGGRGLVAEAQSTEILGAETIVHARLGSGEAIAVSARGIHRIARGERIELGIDEARAHVFDEDGVLLPPGEGATLGVCSRVFNEMSLKR